MESVALRERREELADREWVPPLPSPLFFCISRKRKVTSTV